MKSEKPGVAQTCQIRGVGFITLSSTRYQLAPTGTTTVLKIGYMGRLGSKAPQWAEHGRYEWKELIDFCLPYLIPELPPTPGSPAAVFWILGMEDDS